jgi:hypothetical protein
MNALGHCVQPLAMTNKQGRHLRTPDRSKCICWNRYFSESEPKELKTAIAKGRSGSARHERIAHEEDLPAKGAVVQPLVCSLVAHFIGVDELYESVDRTRLSAPSQGA